jgi:predicted dithiol-disulfide oxidoreductase (DUF899 family)
VPGDRCVGCSLEVDHLEALLEHLENHDATYVAVARAAVEEIGVTAAHGMALPLMVNGRFRAHK